jgi:hypothetical protein
MSMSMSTSMMGSRDSGFPLSGDGLSVVVIFFGILHDCIHENILILCLCTDIARL